MKNWKLTNKLVCSLLILSQLLSFNILPNTVYASYKTSSTSSSNDDKEDDKKSSKMEFVETAAEYAVAQVLIEAMIEGFKRVPDAYHLMKNKWDERDKNGYNAIMISKDNLMDNIYSDDNGKLYGQEQAKDKMINYVMNSLYNIDKLRNNKKSKENVSGNVIYLIGPSGSGKTTMAKGVAEAILKDTNKSLFFVDTSAISSDKMLDRQLFKTIDKKDLKNEDRTYGLFNKERKAPILEFILKHKESVVIIDDYDKMKMLQANMFAKNAYENYDEIPEDRTADEVLKSIAETGKYYVDGNEIDCRKVLFIVTSNESADELKFNFGIGGDIGGGYQRLKIVEFDRLSLDACKKIVQRMLCKATKELTDYNGRFKLNSFEVDEASINAMATDIYNDETSQGRLERTLYNDIMALFSLNIGEDYDKSFKVTYTPASNDELLGTFSKQQISSIKQLRTVDCCGESGLYPIMQNQQNDFAGNVTTQNVPYKELIYRLNKFKTKNINVSLIDGLDDFSEDKIRLINQKIFTRLFKQIQSGQWIEGDSVKITVYNRKNSSPEVMVEFVKSDVNSLNMSSSVLGKKLNKASLKILKILNTLQ